MTAAKKGILILANETVESPVVESPVVEGPVVEGPVVEGSVLQEAIALGLGALGKADVTIVAPALNSRTRHWVSDEEPARRAAELRLARCINRLAAEGVYAEGWVGDADPLLAIADAIRQVPVDLLIVVTQPEERSNWLARDLIDRARRQFALPVLHIVADRESRHEQHLDAVGEQPIQARLAKIA